jgi:transcriptional regulator of acetoin/glycerol metabolism
MTGRILQVETEDRSLTSEVEDGGRAAPGLIEVWSSRRATLSPLELAGGAPLVIGREGDAAIDDRKLSRRHVEIACAHGTWRVKDLDSHNGTFVDGEQIRGEVVRTSPPRVVRAGETLLVPCADVRMFRRGGIELADGLVVGPTLRAAHDAIAVAARTSATLHVTGETGAGKELAARRFHTTGPFVAVNCAAIPSALAESLLFGVKRGAFSGADADRDGYFASADKGTLFLDEIGELPLEVQAKLLRAVESGEVMAVGATRPRAAAIRLCTATHHDLRALVAAGTFRQDLYYRIGRPVVAVPPLRDRPEDVGYLALAAIAKVAPKLTATASFVEQLLIRPWPGNARELLAEVADAATRALAAGADTLAADRLADDAGMPIEAAGDGPRTADRLDARAIAEALDHAGGNVSAAARALGVHRNQLRRILARG